MLKVQNETSLLLNLLACPWDKANLEQGEAQLVCRSCGRIYPIEDGIPVFITHQDKANQDSRGTNLFEARPDYFDRLHTKRIKEWGTVPYLSETFTPVDSWALDIGSGAGTVVILNGKKGIRSVGLDISIHGAKLGLANARRSGLTNCYFVVGDAVRLPFCANSFRLITNYTTIEHLYDPNACLREMQRVAVPNGRVLVNTINNFSIRREKGITKALKDFGFEFRDYLRGLIRREPPPAPQGASPATITYDTWMSGEEMDLYHARSYDLLHRIKKLFDIDFYTTNSYSREGVRYILSPDLNVVKTPLSLFRKLTYRVLTAFDRLPLLRHIGTTITIVGRKTSAN